MPQAPLGPVARLAPVLAACLLAAPAAAADLVDPVPVVIGKPAHHGAEAVALCPHIGARPEIYMSGAGQGLAGRLAGEGYRVYLVNPWDSQAARTRGIEGVVGEVFPHLLKRLKEMSGSERVTWIGHGACGVLPLALAATGSDGGSLPEVRWVGLGTRLDYRYPAPAEIEWLEVWARGERPLPKQIRRLMLTGLRDALGPRPASTPPHLDQSDAPEAALAALYKESFEVSPPAAVVEDLLRWFRDGRMTSEEGWIDYERGFSLLQGSGLLLAGATDPVAPPEDALAALRRFPEGRDVSFRLMSRAGGHREEYGHLGLLLSRWARRDIDATIAAWLDGKRYP